MKPFKPISRDDLKDRLSAIFTKKRLLIAGGIVVAFLLLTPILTYAYYAHDISNRDRLMNRNDTGIILKDRSGKVFYEYGNVTANNDVPLSQISDHVEHALIASEDKNFYSEPGFSLKGTIAAAYANLIHGSATYHGGSTITQQLVKNKLLSPHKNYLRKYQEISMAIAVDRKYSKDDILDMYLNSAYFGDGAFGIAEAAKTYFNKKPADLTLAESSILVGLLPAPSAYSPITGNVDKAKARQNYVLSQMVDMHFITKDKKQAAEAVKLTYAPPDANPTNSHAQHFAQMVIDQLKQKYGEERATRGGYVVSTTLDLDWQKQAEEIVKKRVAQTQSRGGRNAAMVAEDPTNGEVRALVGSVDWNNKDFGQVNMATTPRQPGSSFKPIYYSKALEKKLITPATILDDSKTTFGKNYTPKDYDNRYKGKMTVRSALAESRNVPAVEVMQKLGVANAIAAAHEMGLNTIKDDPSKYGLSLALGTAEVRLVDMVNAYTAFANQGVMHDQVLITKVQDKYGKTVYKNKTTDKRVRSEGSAYEIASILSDKQARAPTYGTSMNIPGRDVAFKTGTTNDNVDAWTIGFTPNLVVGAWLGNNEHQPMQGLAGGSGAGVMERQMMIDTLPKLPRKDFQKPASVVRIRICEGTEARATSSGSNTYFEYFIKGTEPKKTCNANTPPPPPQPKAPTPPKDQTPTQPTPPPTTDGGNTQDQNNTGTTDTTGGTTPPGGTGDTNGGTGGTDGTGGTPTQPPSGGGQGSDGPGPTKPSDPGATYDPSANNNQP